MRVRLFIILLLVAATVTAGASAQQLRKQELAVGVNCTRVPTIGCAGATPPDVIPALKQEGYAAIINLRHASGRGADVEGQKALAEAAARSQPSTRHL